MFLGPHSDVKYNDDRRMIMLIASDFGPYHDVGYDNVNPHEFKNDTDHPLIMLLQWY